MWLICAGGKRSGSTLQYNIIAGIVEATDSGKRIPHFKPEDFPTIKETEKDYNDLKVIKSHLLTDSLEKEIQRGNAIIFHCYRDIRDVAVSAIHKGWIKHTVDEIIALVNSYLEIYTEWRKYEAKWVSRKYEEFVFQIREEILFLANSLDIEITEKQVEEIAQSLELQSLKENQDKVAKDVLKTVDNQTFDKKTLLHTNHIHDGSPNQFLKKLTSNEITKIEAIAYSFLINNEYELYWSKTNIFLSFSQHADDYIAWQLLGKKPKGTVVEIGAFDGKHLSNSYSLEQLGWQAICVEPSPDIFQYLVENRPKAININKAIVGDEATKEITFYSEEIGVLSGVVYDEDDIKRRYEKRGLSYKAPKKTSVEATTLNTLFREHTIGNVDVLSIDVEGYELEVLQGLDLTNISIGLFIIEANDASFKSRILQFFQAHKNYVFIGSNYQNLFIINRKLLKRRNLKNLDFEHYVPAKQEHPISEKLAIDAIPPDFVKTGQFFNYLKPFKFF